MKFQLNTSNGYLSSPNWTGQNRAQKRVWCLHMKFQPIICNGLEVSGGTDQQADRQTDRQTDQQTDRPTSRFIGVTAMWHYKCVQKTLHIHIHPLCMYVRFIYTQYCFTLKKQIKIYNLTI